MSQAIYEKRETPKQSSNTPSLRSSSRKTISASKSETRETNAIEIIKRVTRKKGNKSEIEYSPDIQNHDSEEEEFKVSTKKVRKTDRSNSKNRSKKDELITPANKSATSRKDADDFADGMVNLDAPKEQKVNQEDLFVPPWLLPENIKDKEGRRPDEEGYDPTTLLIPEKGTKSMRQRRFWEIKSDHFDKIVAYKFGFFYLLFCNDAFVAHKLLDLNLHIYKSGYSTMFHETHLRKYAKKLLDHGYKVVVVEQMETGQTKEDDVLRREICQILTPGTWTEFDNSGYTPRFCLCLYEKKSAYGIVFLDTTTHDFFVGEFEDSIHKGTLKTLLTRLKPLEVVYINGNLSQYTLDLCKNLSNRPSLNPIYSNVGEKKLEDILAKIGTYFENEDEWPESLETMRDMLESPIEKLKKLKNGEVRKKKEEELPFYSTLQSISICIDFLERALLADTVFKMGNFLPYDVALEKKSSLYLDSQALESLEIFEIKYELSRSETSVGSLFNYMDKTATDFGRRMLRKWMACPLLDPEKINERLDAVEDLMENEELLDLFQGALSKLPDLERMINKVYNLSNKRRMSAVYFEDFAKNRLKDFLSFLNELEGIDKIIQTFQGQSAKIKSRRLKQLISFKEDKKKAGKKASKSEATESTGIFPKTIHIVQELKNMVTIVDGLPIPVKGTTEEGDRVIDDIGKIKTKLNKILEQEKKRFRDSSIKYVHTRHRYELEIPELLVKGSRRPENYVITSKRNGFLRFQTPEIEECIRELNEVEVELQKILIDFIVDYFKTFYDYNLVWRQVVICLGELDCLCGLARTSASMKLKCRPNVLAMARENEQNVFELKGMAHPSLAAQIERKREFENFEAADSSSHKDKTKNLSVKTNEKPAEDFNYKTNSKARRSTRLVRSGSKEGINLNANVSTEASADHSLGSTPFKSDVNSEGFVRNDVVKDADLDIFLITGPNMGGKSTLLRQTALAVIMAQMGCMIPARSFEFSAIDRIFTRIGAEDKIFEGKSTFFLEMEETWNIVKEATKSSLLLIDELGRGTSTYDGVSLAYGTLKYIANKTRSITMFATHYHILLEEFQLYKNIQNYYMASRYNEETEEIKFLYKFMKGQADRSHSFAVAKMAGLSAETLENAKEKARTVTKEKQKIDQVKLVDEKFNRAIETLSLLVQDKQETTALVEALEKIFN